MNIKWKYNNNIQANKLKVKNMISRISRSTQYFYTMIYDIKG